MEISSLLEAGDSPANPTLAGRAKRARDTFFQTAAGRLNRYELSSLQLWIAAGALLMSLLFCSILAYTVNSSNQHDIEKIELQNKNFSHALNQYLSAAFQLVDYTLKEGRTEWMVSHRLKDHREFYKSFPNFKSLIIQVAVVDAQGILRATSVDATPDPVYLGDRLHFKAHVGSAADSLYISQPVIGRVSKRPAIQFSRPIFDSDGRFNGVIVVSIDADFLKVMVNEDSPAAISFGLMGVDGVARLWEGRTDFVPSNIENNLGGIKFSAGKLHGEFTTLAVSSHAKYFWHAEPLRDFSLYVVSGGEQSGIFEEINRRKNLAIVLALIFVVTIFAFSFYLIRALRYKNKILCKLGESQIKANSANLMKSRFVATISHELRTPLNGILGFSELISTSTDIDRINRYGDIIHTSAQHLYALVNTLLDLAKIEAGKMEVIRTACELCEVCESVTSIHLYAAEKKGLILSSNYAPDLPKMINTDRIKLMQILNNILHNAVKFTVTGGVFFHVTQTGNQWMFRVTDSGIGMSPFEVEHVFDHFGSSDFSKKTVIKEQGSGLGMALCKELVELLGGSIHVTSTLGTGTVVEFLLPTNDAVSLSSS